MRRLLITGCSELITLRGPAPRRGSAMSDLGIIADGAILVAGDRIAALGPRSKLEKRADARHAEKRDLGGRVLLPGFVDSHTHLVHPESRAAEYELRIQGKTYEEIARSGGGILSSAQRLRRATRRKLKSRALAHLRQIAAHGTTTVEAKSGYGLDPASETKILEVIRDLRAEQPLDIVPTFLGAHSVPAEFRKSPEKYVDLVIEEMIPQAAKAGLAEFCDVYCDRGAFTLSQSRRILTAGLAAGLAPRIHAEQLAHTGAAQLAVELEAASADHLEMINRHDVQALARSRVAATLLPGCCFHLGLTHFAPARALLDAGAIVALATDFNPGTSPTPSMQMILSLACTQLRFTPAEAIVAATINAAYSLHRAGQVGSLEVGKYADFAAFDVADHREIPYYFGVNHCVLTVKRGRIIYSRLPH